MKKCFEKIKGMRTYQKILLVLVLVFAVFTDIVFCMDNIMLVIVGMVLTVTAGIVLYKSCGTE